MQFKIKSPIKIQYEHPHHKGEIKGIVYAENSEYLYLISDSKFRDVDRETYSSHNKITLLKKYIKDVSSTRFPKPISDALKELFDKIKSIENIQNQIKKLQEDEKHVRSDISSFEASFVKIKFNHTDDIKTIVSRFKEDAVQGKDFYTLYGNNSTSIDVNNICVEDGVMKFYLDLSQTKRNIVTITSHNGHYDYDSHDWDSIAEKHAPRYDNTVKHAFNFVKIENISRNAQYGEKGYCTVSSQFKMTVKINKANYNDVLASFKNALNELKSAYLA